jgi:Putative Ig domain
MTAELLDSSTVQPKFMVPRPIRLTRKPERPKCPYAISSLMPGAYVSRGMAVTDADPGSPINHMNEQTKECLIEARNVQCSHWLHKWVLNEKQPAIIKKALEPGVNFFDKANVVLHRKEPADRDVAICRCGNLFTSGGVQPYTWSVVAGALPPGLTLSNGENTISGTPTTAGTFTFTVRVTDDLGAFTEKELSITIS